MPELTIEDINDAVKKLWKEGIRGQSNVVIFREAYEAVKDDPGWRTENGKLLWHGIAFEIIERMDG